MSEEMTFEEWKKLSNQTKVRITERMIEMGKATQTGCPLLPNLLWATYDCPPKRKEINDILIDDAIDPPKLINPDATIKTDCGNTKTTPLSADALEAFVNKYYKETE